MTTGEIYWLLVGIPIGFILAILLFALHEGFADEYWRRRKYWMPPLPEKEKLHTVMPDDYRYGHVYGYTKQQMRYYAEKAVKAYKERLTPTAWAYYWSDGGLCSDVAPKLKKIPID